MVDPESKSEAFHVSFDPHPPSTVLQSPITEILRAYFPTDQVSSEGAAFEAELHKLVNALRTNKIAGHTGEMSSGWSIEEVDQDGIPSKVFVAYIGWDSVEAHVEARKTAVFQANRLTHVPKNIKVVHVKVKSP